eukprot:m.47098 g.47098  ORF g.47098 m.47098 type:complete len:77 (-) comp13201_c0_seq1:1649-1879(-)
MISSSSICSYDKDLLITSELSRTQFAGQLSPTTVFNSTFKVLITIIPVISTVGQSHKAQAVLRISTTCQRRQRCRR